MLNRLIKRPFFFQLNSLKRNFASKAISPIEEILLETKDDIDIKYEDEAFYLSKELKELEEDKFRK